MHRQVILLAASLVNQQRWNKEAVIMHRETTALQGSQSTRSLQGSEQVVINSHCGLMTFEAVVQTPKRLSECHISSHRAPPAPKGGLKGNLASSSMLKREMPQEEVTNVACSLLRYFRYRTGSLLSEFEPVGWEVTNVACP